MAIALTKRKVMKKILVAINVEQFNKEVVDFACYLAELTHSNLVALFLENLQEDEVPVRKSLMGHPYIETIVIEDVIGNRRIKRMSEESMTHFKDICERREVKFTMHSKSGILEEAVIAETRYADLLVIDPETHFGEVKQAVPTKFTEDILQRSECPVVIAPYHFYGIQEVLFAYDGKRSSVFAMKQLACLFPELQNKTLTVLHVSDDRMLQKSEQSSLAEYLGMHFSKIIFEELSGKPGDEIFGYLLERKDVFVVMGAYSRKLVPNLFRRSAAALVMEAVNLPVFIAHV